MRKWNLEESVLYVTVGYLILLSFNSFVRALELSSDKEYLIGEGSLYLMLALTYVVLVIIGQKRRA